MSGVVLCVGEPLVVLLPPAGQSLETAESLAVSIGGAEANVAVHLSRLGVPARFAGRIGDDPFGRRVRSQLEREGVDVSALAHDPDRPTGLYVKEPAPQGTVAYYYRTGSAASALDGMPLGALDDVVRVHVSGILASLSAECLAVVGSLLDGAVPVSFDVNFRPALWPNGDAAAALLALARRAATVFVGLDEAAELWRCVSADDVRSMLPTVELVVKAADGPATAFVADGRVEVAALAVDVVEPVGAGDTFAAGYLSVRVSGGDVAQALRTGHAVASGALSASDDHGEPVDAGLLHAAMTGEGWPGGAG